MDKKIACVIYHYGEEFKKMGQVASDSFRAHNPDIDLYHIHDENIKNYRSVKVFHKINKGARKLLLASEIMTRYGYNRIIVLGADTITCARLDELINSTEDVVAALNYPYELKVNGVRLSDGPETHVNADVLCFNNLSALTTIIENSNNFLPYNEQGALNWLINGKKLGLHDMNYTYRIVDAPWEDSKVAYNARAKGNVCQGDGEPAPWAPYTTKFYVKNQKLYTPDHKQIKVWHYCEAFGQFLLSGSSKFNEILNSWIFDWFNEETKTFFKDRCNTRDFFEKRYEE